VIYQFVPLGPFPISLYMPIDARVSLFAFVVALVVTLACGLFPALRSSRVSPMDALRSGGRASSGGYARLRNGIVAAQIAFSLLCLVTAQSFITGLRASSAVDPGFADPEHVLLITTSLSPARLSDSAGATAIREILRGARALPSVTSASVATMVPLGFGGRQTADIKVDGYVAGPAEDISALRSSVGDNYAATMGIRVVRGRDIAEADRADALPVALVNETFARHYWPASDALGRRIDAGHGWMTVVGVLHDGKYGGLTERPRDVVYVPISQWYQPSFTVHARSRVDPRLMVEPMRAVLRRVNIDLPALQPRTLAEHAAASTFVQRTGASTLSAFGVMALLLSAVGLYGALTVAVAFRTRELGIRLALGARDASIMWLVLRQALVILGWGTVGGLPLIALASYLVRQRFVEAGLISAGELLAIAALFGVTALVAAIAPARRAVRVQAATVLRSYS
jgi:predicted permease